MNAGLGMLLAVLCAVPAAAQQAPAPSAPAVGYDWNDGSSADDRFQQTLWPRSDASAAGLDDMIHPEQALIHEDGDFGSRAVHGLRKVGGGYIVVPVLKNTSGASTASDALMT